ncbi:hypothetical protein WME79_26460 [Sorangium sp. So ce726]|uniref:hypothetical protein n=1 Tax=Sorangium sp. So ce726 TaxID=3133319 RepID=UPI003F627FEB
MNPYAPPTASIEPHAASVEQISPEQRLEIQKKLSRSSTLSFLFGVPGFLLQSVGRAMDNAPITLLGVALFITALVYYAKMRGRSGAWGIVGLGTCIGLALLYFLPKHCLNCAAKHSYRSKDCNRCGAPLGS